jgi:hypothetical protein
VRAKRIPKLEKLLGGAVPDPVAPKRTARDFFRAFAASYDGGRVIEQKANGHG